jgi:hypothetical protein
LGTTADAAQLVVVDSPYDDSLLLEDFQLSIPDGAMISGIQFDVRHATESGNALDDTVKILRNGAPVGVNHELPQSWPKSLTYTTYGNASDSWGVQWTASDLRSTGFGLSISPRYTGPSAGNDHAYIDSIRATIFYSTDCDAGSSD